MAGVSLSSVPTKSLLNIIIFGGGIVLFVLLAVLPAQKDSSALDFQIENLNTRIEEQKILTPVYENLLKKAELQPPGELKPVEKKKLKRGETSEVVEAFTAMANNHKLKLVEFAPEVESLISNADFLVLDIVLNGEFFNLHPFMIELCQQPYLEQIERIQIRSVSDPKEFQLRVWLAHE